MAGYPYKAKEQVEALINILQVLHEKDAEQEVRGIAVPVFDAVLEEIKDAIGKENRVVQSVAGIISPEMIEEGEPIRVADALMVARLLDAEIGHRPPPPPASRPSWLS
jgi:hypothetical protein